VNPRETLEPMPPPPAHGLGAGAGVGHVVQANDDPAHDRSHARTMDGGAPARGDDGVRRGARERSALSRRIGDVRVESGYSVVRQLQQLARSRAVEEEPRRRWLRKR